MIDYKIADWTVHPQRDELSRGEQLVKLEARVMQVLVYFCKNPGRVISRDELTKAVWGDIAVSDNSANVAITAIRQALGDNIKNPTYIKTLQKKGYLLLPDVTTVRQGSAQLTQMNWRKRIGVAAIFVALIYWGVLSATSPSRSIESMIKISAYDGDKSLMVVPDRRKP